MTTLLTQEQFWKRMVNKRDSLLDQKTKKIDEEISMILKWIDFEKLSLEQQSVLVDIARSEAESKTYLEDLMLTILKNIWNNADENHYWEAFNKKAWHSLLTDQLIFDFFCW